MRSCSAVDERDDRLTRRDVLRLGGACVGGAGMLGLIAAYGGDAETLAATTAATRRGRRRDPLAQNAILIVTDSTRADHLGAYGDKRGLTPNLDALARDGLTFEHAHPESMPTGPARNALLTGDREFPFRGWHDERFLPGNPGWSPIPRNQATMASLLRRHGVTTAYVTDNPFLIGPRYRHVRRDFDRFRGFPGQAAHYSRRHRKPVPLEQARRFMPRSLHGSGAEAALALYLAYAPHGQPEDETFTARVFRAAIDLLATLRERQPFLLVVDAFDPHEPWDPPAAWARRVAGRSPLDYEPLHPFPAPIGSMDVLGLSRAVARRVGGLYAAELAFADHWIGNLLGEVDAGGLADTTAVMYTSDHGIFLGEHGLIGKSGRNLHREIHHTPFIVRDPARRRPGARSGFFASTNDVAPTLMSYLGVRPGRRMDGEDLTVLFDRRAPPRRPYMTASYDDYVMCGDGRWLLTARSDGSDRKLFDTKRDPRERRNVIGRHPDVAARLWRALRREAGGPLPRFGPDRVLR